MKILVTVLSGIGDALMFTPALLKLKEAIPDSQIDAMVMFKGVEDIYKNLPQISKIHYWDFLKESKIKSLGFMFKLRREYDVVINAYPSNRLEYNIISLLTSAPKRVSVEYLRMDYQNLGYLNNVRVEENDSLHNVEENIRLVEKIIGEKINEIPPMQLILSEEDLSFSSDYLEEKNIGIQDLVIGFHPGCATLKNHTKRRWEPEKFAELGSQLIQNKDVKILIFGGPEEQELKETIFNKINSANAVIVNTKSLTQTAAVMKRCNIFVTNDSSLMHVASALQLDTVAIIGPTNKNYIHPWKTKHKIVSLNLECSPCFFYSPKPLSCSRTDVKFKCIKELGADLVYEAVLSLINSN
jgi:lipopolysaccharide heptosyltransferase II